MFVTKERQNGSGTYEVSVVAPCGEIKSFVRNVTDESIGDDTGSGLPIDGIEIEFGPEVYLGTYTLVLRTSSNFSANNEVITAILITGDTVNNDQIEFSSGFPSAEAGRKDYLFYIAVEGDPPLSVP
jgi:hypothetical protein